MAQPQWVGARGSVWQSRRQVQGVVVKLRWIPMGLTCGIALSLTLVAVWQAAPHARTAYATSAVVKRYGANVAKVQTAMSAALPQQRSNWCGISTIAAIAAYRGISTAQLAIA